MKNDKELFRTIIAMLQGKNVEVSKAKQEAYEKLVIKTIEELDTLADRLFSEDVAIRKKAATALERKPLMDLMRNDADCTRAWFIEKSNCERIGKAIEQENDDSVLSVLISTIGFACERFSHCSLLSWSLSIEYLKFGYDFFIKYLNSKSDSVRFTSALALTQFRVTEAWDILYSFTGKINSKIYTRMVNRLFKYGNNRLKISDTRDSTMSQALAALNIVCNTEGLTEEQLKKFRATLEFAYNQKITSETKKAIVLALQSIGNKETITFLTQIAEEEQDKYQKEIVVRAIEMLKEWLK